MSASGRWIWTWVDHRDHYPEVWVSACDEIDDSQQLVRLWVPRGCTTNQAVDLMQSEVAS